MRPGTFRSYRCLFCIEQVPDHIIETYLVREREHAREELLVFDQTFVNTERRSKRPLGVLASLLIQAAVICISILVSIAYTQGLPAAQLRALLLAPKAPVAAHVAQNTPTAKSTAVVRPFRMTEPACLCQTDEPPRASRGSAVAALIFPALSKLRAMRRECLFSSAESLSTAPPPKPPDRRNQRLRRRSG